MRDDAREDGEGLSFETGSQEYGEQSVVGDERLDRFDPRQGR